MQKQLHYLSSLLYFKRKGMGYVCYNNNTIVGSLNKTPNLERNGKEEGVYFRGAPKSYFRSNCFV